MKSDLPVRAHREIDGVVYVSSKNYHEDIATLVKEIEDLETQLLCVPTEKRQRKRPPKGRHKNRS